jgi:acyl-CoA reductase-like NAD-dependent aldehyde dehydrogenase
MHFEWVEIQVKLKSNLFSRLDTLTKQTKGELLYKSAESNDRSDLFIGPHIFKCQSDDVLMQEEVSMTLFIQSILLFQIFGPILSVLLMKDLDEAIQYVNDHEKPLGLYVFTNDQANADRVINETSSGGVTVNGVVIHASVPDLPFGGVGNSGMGRSNGKFGFDTFSHEKAVLTAAKP